MKHTVLNQCALINTCWGLVPTWPCKVGPSTHFWQHMAHKDTGSSCILPCLHTRVWHSLACEHATVLVHPWHPPPPHTHTYPVPGV